jgi:hypothetical protein
MITEKRCSWSTFWSSALWLLVLSFVSINSAGGAVRMDKKTTLYQLMWETDNVVGQVAINGFVVAELDGSPGSGSASLNTWLTGENEITVTLRKADQAKAAEFAVGVSELAPGAITSTTDRGKLLSLEIKNSDFAKNAEVRAGKKFSSTLDFSGHLSPAGEITESDVLAYAKKIHILFEKKDADGILQESAIKIEDYSLAFGGQDFRSALKSYLVDDFFKNKLAKIKPTELRAVQVGPTKTLWHVLNGRDELLTTASDDGSSAEIAVFIGRLDGKLQIVR